jgi:hypothetical protein
MLLVKKFDSEHGFSWIETTEGYIIQACVDDDGKLDASTCTWGVCGDENGAAFEKYGQEACITALTSAEKMHEEKLGGQRDWLKYVQNSEGKYIRFEQAVESMDDEMMNSIHSHLRKWLIKCLSAKCARHCSNIQMSTYAQNFILTWGACA